MKNQTKMEPHECDVLIIGTGVTGYAAAMYSARFNLKTIIIGSIEGGTIIQTDDVSNYPGFKKVTGMELYQKLKDHALDYPVTILNGLVDSIKKTNNIFIATSKKYEISTKTIILATGTIARKLNIPGEKKFFGNGVHTCALCDGPFYNDKILAIVGGSDSAAKEALLLTQFGKKVYIIYRGDKIRPEPINYEKVLKNKKIEIIYQTNITSIEKKDNQLSLTLDKPYNNKNELILDAIFIEIGHIALSDLAKDLGVKLNKNGEVIIDKDSYTNVPGFYAAGDVTNRNFKQAITGVAEGVVATYSAYNYIDDNF